MICRPVAESSFQSVQQSCAGVLQVHQGTRDIRRTVIKKLSQGKGAYDRVRLPYIARLKR